ncbi:MAG TPA: hypothetical protein PK156_03865 [Polyangium sp.]|nr:hypothetical protein [Polyangium sp.]
MKSKLVPPQLVINSRMLYFGWVPEDPKAARALLPKGLDAKENTAIFMNQYVVDRPEQTSGFGAYSLTYIGLDLEGLDAPDGVTPGRFWTGYFNSSEEMRAYVRERGVPATEGQTAMTLEGDKLEVLVTSKDKPIIRTVARVGGQIGDVLRGQLRYFTELGSDFLSGIYPYISEAVTPWSIESLEFLDPSHPVYALRPRLPLEITWGFYAPRASFCYPGGEERIKR